MTSCWFKNRFKYPDTFGAANTVNPMKTSNLCKFSILCLFVFAAFLFLFKKTHKFCRVLCSLSDSEIVCEIYTFCGVVKCLPQIFISQRRVCIIFIPHTYAYCSCITVSCIGPLIAFIQCLFFQRLLCQRLSLLRESSSASILQQYFTLSPHQFIVKTHLNRWNTDISKYCTRKNCRKEFESRWKKGKCQIRLLWCTK